MRSAQRLPSFLLAEPEPLQIPSRPAVPGWLRVAGEGLLLAVVVSLCAAVGYAAAHRSAPESAVCEAR